MNRWLCMRSWVSRTDWIPILNLYHRFLLAVFRRRCAYYWNYQRAFACMVFPGPFDSRFFFPWCSGPPARRPFRAHPDYERTRKRSPWTYYCRYALEGWPSWSLRIFQSTSISLFRWCWRLILQQKGLLLCYSYGGNLRSFSRQNFWVFLLKDSPNSNKTL